ncbi:hypothetical protein GCM10009775_34880 [Microbacterium aoyamense]|uniref:DUF1648 domain-containing protein n=1 Tax=Microbacterium aoyamense TaxID=344166 RepID=A0ABP5BBK8_9MICO
MGLWIPLVVVTGALVLMLVWLPGMPETIAIHWNARGEADGFAAARTTPALFAAVGYGLPLLLSLLGLAGNREGEWGPTYRFLATISLATTAFLTTLITWTFAAQRGLADTHDAPSIVPALAVGAGLGVAAGVAGWFAQPKLTVSGGSAAGDSVPAITLEPGERVVWLRTTTMARGGVFAIVGSTVLVAGLAVAFALIGIDIWWVMALIALLFAVLAVTTCVFRVRVDSSGLRVVSPVGIPRFRVALDDISSVSVVHVNPMAEFGGWGIRLGVDGRFGIVLHSGQAIQVVRRSGKTFVVTVDDAETGAALLTALAARARA